MIPDEETEGFSYNSKCYDYADIIYGTGIYACAGSFADRAAEAL